VVLELLSSTDVGRKVPGLVVEEGTLSETSECVQQMRESEEGRRVEAGEMGAVADGLPLLPIPALMVCAEDE
jgi:hypothetical protein